jgi:hypothetical protein
MRIGHKHARAWSENPERFSTYPDLASDGLPGSSKRIVQKRGTAHEVGKSMSLASQHPANFPPQRFIDGIAVPRL